MLSLTVDKDLLRKQLRILVKLNKSELYGLEHLISRMLQQLDEKGESTVTTMK